MWRITTFAVYMKLLRPRQRKRWALLGALGIGELIDAALATQPITPIPTAPDRRKAFRVIEGGRN
jgi:hypothetical protein